jgi:hypothetical protein
MPRTPIAHTLGELEKLANSVTPEDTAGRPHLEYSHGKLRENIERIHQLITERDFHEARQQEATREIRELLEDSRRGATVLRRELKYEKGHDSEELARFHIQPFRGKKRKKKEEETPDENGPPSSDEPAT